LLPTPDATGTISMASGAGKVVLMDVATTITSGTSCPSGVDVMDIVGYGSTANCFEGSGPTPAPSATNAVFRGSGGCRDSANNASDFSAAAASPRNTGTALNPCNAPTNPTGTCTATPSVVDAGSSTLLKVTVTPGINPASSGMKVTV